MKYLVRDGVKLAYQESGSGAPPIIFVHGWTCNRTYFAPQQEYFSRLHRTVALDLRGHGESDKPVQKYPMSSFAEDLAWVCRELKIEKPVVVGHSMGGVIALQIAAQFPDLPRAVVACDSPIVLNSVIAGAIGGTSERFKGPNWRDGQREFIAGAMFLPFSDPKLKNRILDEMTSAPDHVALGCWQAIVETDTVALVSKCKVPFLNLLAASPLCDVAKVRELCPAVITGQTVGAGHFHQLEVPDQLNAMIERFLQIALR